MPMEKLVFSTDSVGRVLIPHASEAVPHEAAWLRVRLRLRSPATQGTAVPAGATFDLRLDRLRGGMLPERAVPMLGAVAVAILGTALGVLGLKHTGVLGPSSTPGTWTTHVHGDGGGEGERRKRE